MADLACFTSVIGCERTDVPAFANQVKSVLVILPSAMVGGAERVAHNLVTALLAEGNRVTVYTMTRGAGPLWPRLEGEQGFTHIASHAPSEKRGLLDFVIRSRALRAMGPFDLVYTTHVHVNALTSLALRLGLLQAKRFVSRESTRIFDRFRGRKSWIYRLAYRFYGRQDLLIFQTEEMRASLEQAIALPPHLIRAVVPNPVNLANVDAAIAKEPHSAPRGAPFRIVFCGRLIPLKRVSLLFDALAKLDDERAWQLDILGDGPLREELAIDAERLGLASRVKFHGNVANPYAIFAGADLGVLVSTIEGFPNVLLEMMASGTKKIIATPCTPAVRDLPELAMLENATPDDLVAMIASIIDQRPDCSAVYRAHVERRHSIARFAQMVLEGAAEEAP